MALFKHFRGNRASLAQQPVTDGYAYFCVDDGTFHIDFKDVDGVVKRKQINAKDAETINGRSVDDFLLEVDIDRILAQAKESGEFNGEDGISVTHTWDGTRLVITSASGTSSTDLKGEKGDQGVSGVYIGSGDMPEGYNIQIDPNGEASIPGGVTSWNDLTDKPFDEQFEQTTILEECEVAIGENRIWASLPATTRPFNTENSTYIVTFQGVEYNCTPMLVKKDCMVLGNATILDYEGGNNEPFAIDVYTDNNGLFTEGYLNVPEEGPAVYSVKIQEVASIITPLDRKYLDFDIDDYVKTEVLDDYVKTEDMGTYLTDYAKSADMSTVATSGSWNDLVDRPFGEWEDYTEVWTNITITSLTNGILPTPPIALQEGDTWQYRATNSGKAYETQIIKIDDYLIGGNPSLIRGGDYTDNGEPIVFYYYSGNKTYFVKTEDSRIYNTFSAGKITDVFKFLDEKYIPDTIARTVDIPSTEGLATEKYVDEAIANIDLPGGGGGGGDVIIDVIALPTENINEKAFYRVLTAQFLYGQFIKNDWTMYVVETLPETGEMCWDGTTAIAYYCVETNNTFGYVNDALSSMMGVPVGWYPADILIPTIGKPYGGIISDIEQAEDGTAYTYLKNILYSHKDGFWSKIDTIGWRGTGESSEIFNHLSNTASGGCSHAEGHSTTASGNRSHAEGDNTKAVGYASHSEGQGTWASGHYSHSEGHLTGAFGQSSHVEGEGTYADSYCAHVQGTYNIYDEENRYAHIVGNGQNDDGRSNAHTLDWSGNAWFQGEVFIGGTGQDDETAKKLATTEDIENALANAGTGGTIPIFNLIEMGMEEHYIGDEITSLYTDTSNILAAMRKGVVGFIIPTSYGPVSIYGLALELEATQTPQIICSFVLQGMFGDVSVTAGAESVWVESSFRQSGTSEERVLELINEALGVIENGTY